MKKEKLYFPSYVVLVSSEAVFRVLCVCVCVYVTESERERESKRKTEKRWAFHSTQNIKTVKAKTQRQQVGFVPWP